MVHPPPFPLCSLHRTLVYPYLRLWVLSELALSDVAMVWTLGRRCILRCLLHMHAVFQVGCPLALAAIPWLLSPPPLV